ncbi:acyl-CoA synthetase [Hoyosella subflava]|uniref:Putative acyl-CoA synthetase n=1 Tax=Hoyosella subflava (strain DSM 45089 / JCM 17490 / NBRC 109087 / DQS3-9A1) TaxID=443218 RepID=F6EPY2_HOYSD|nr:acyl-CoA synthetase [Hoyosella subflava]AEF41803.1 Putative acyl-CoA synthetase [Hoyosella subflava DQS3-9A1]
MLLTSLHDAAISDDTSPAFTIGGESLTRQELIGAATAAAARVQGAAAVAVLATPTAKTVVSVTGALLAGVPVVPVPPDSGPGEVSHILRDSGAQAWLGSAPDLPGIPKLHAIPVRIHARDWHQLLEPPRDTPAFIMYTSGTTGPPKGAVISRGAIAAGLDALAEAWAWTAEDTLVHGLPLFHVHGLVLGMLGPLRTGSRLVHTGKPSPESYASAKGSLYFGVPTVWSRIAADPSAAKQLSGARLLVSGSAGLSAPVFESMKSLSGHQLVERYGMTETLITVSARADGERRPGWVGRPLRGVNTRIVGEDGGEVSHDGESIGQLHVRGPMMFSGYTGQPEVTAAAFAEDGWFRTGDIAAIDESGFHRIVGRESTDLIKSGGYRIGAGEVESALLAHPGITEAAVIGVADDDLGQKLVAYVVGDLDRSDDGAAVIEFVAKYLSAHKRPREVRVVDALPRNAMGKVQKRQLS